MACWLFFISVMSAICRMQYRGLPSASRCTTTCRVVQISPPRGAAHALLGTVDGIMSLIRRSICASSAARAFGNQVRQVGAVRARPRAASRSSATGLAGDQALQVEQEDCRWGRSRTRRGTALRSGAAVPGRTGRSLTFLLTQSTPGRPSISSSAPLTSVGIPCRHVAGRHVNVAEPALDGDLLEARDASCGIDHVVEFVDAVTEELLDLAAPNRAGTTVDVAGSSGPAGAG